MTKKKIFIFRHNKRSQGATRLSECLGIPMIKSKNSSFIGDISKTLINWGHGSDFPFCIGETTVINPPDKVGRVTNKRIFLEMCRDSGSVCIPDFTTEKEIGVDWLQNDEKVFARTILQGSGGEGIVELSEPDDLNNIPDETLLVKYIKKKKEFRIHVGSGGEVFSVQEKKKSKNVLLEDVNWRIRNHENGFIFARIDLEVPNSVFEEAKAALEVSGLDFGAVDVLWNERHSKAVVLEINTAPGLEGTTTNDYAKFFQKRLGLKDELKFVNLEIQTNNEYYGL